MTKIFISYRHNDDPYAARGINDALCGQVGEQNIYFDMDALQAGLDWRKQIDAMVAKCDAMLVVIGDDWLQVDDSGRSRLENEDDLVRQEVSSALNRDIPVIPVLVGKATIPAKDSLPKEIQSLVYRQAVEVRATANFNAQIENLLRSIEAIAPEVIAPSGRLKLRTWAYVSASVVMLMAIGWWAWHMLILESAPDEEPMQETIQKHALTINPEPGDAKIRFLSTGQEYQQGVLLASGRYHVEVSRPGYITQTQWLEIVDDNLDWDFVLESVKPGFVDGRVFKDCDECPKMVVIPKGSFVMGGSKSDEMPYHQVSVPSFAIGKYEVTFDEYDAFARSTGKYLPGDEGWGRGNRPVINVSWHDAQAYVTWLSEQTGKRYRLPSEAEWEYSSRGGTSTGYWWGEDIKQDGKAWANCNGCGEHKDTGKTAPVGEFPANPFDLRDTAGNVWEWVEDCMHETYKGKNQPDDGSAWLETDGGDCARRVIRGGSWVNIPENLRSAYRRWEVRTVTVGGLGFRLAQDLPD